MIHQISGENRLLFQSYASEFEKRYLLEPAGQKHLEMYKTERVQVAKYWAEIKESNKRGVDVTDAVLQKLLPYSNTRSNRLNGYRISVAPAITKDIKKWFENVGWQCPENWKNVASAIFELVYHLVERDDWNALTRFENDQEVSKGIKAGFITPTFYFLNPRYRILNSKTMDTVNMLVSRRAIGRDLTRYREYLAVIDAAVEELGLPLFSDADVFDAFCHWMCDKRLGGYARYQKEVQEDEDEEEIIEVLEEDGSEPQNHWEAIYYITKIGNLLGYKTYVADPSRTAFNQKLKDSATLTEVPPILKSAPHIEKVDAIWYKPAPP